MNIIKHLPLGLFVSYCLKYLILSPTYSDIVLISVLGSISAIFQYLLSSKELKEINDKYNSISNKLAEQNKEMNDIKSGIVGLKMGNFRGPKVG